jgi:hypothetical protein
MEDQSPIIVLATYYDPMLAHIIRTRLEDNGIPCIVDDNMMSVYPIYSNAAGGIKLRIFEHDLEKAKAILAEDATLPVEKYIEDGERTVICPNCGSNNVRYGSVKDDANWFTKIVSSVAEALPLGKDEDWHCFNCGKDFEGPENNS